MLTKRLIVCLDVKNGALAKSIRFVDTKEIGDPIEKAVKYYEDGADELVFYDITASHEKRNIMLDWVEKVANKLFTPFSVGGGVRTLQDAKDLLSVGADKININSAAVLNPQLLSECAYHLGSANTVISMDIQSTLISDAIPSGYEVVINGGRKPMNKDAIQWAKEAELLGAGEIVVNVIDVDGVQNGYAIDILKSIVAEVSIPVIASGGAGTPDHLVDVFNQAYVDAALIASMVHYDHYTCSEIKAKLHESGLPTRTHW